MITVVGTVTVAVTALLSQRSVSGAAVRAEADRQRERLRDEEAAKIREKRWDQLVDALAELQAVCDPASAPSHDLARMTVLIHGIDLMLDARIPAQRALAMAVGHLGITTSEFAAARSLSETTAEDLRPVWAGQSRVVELARIVLHGQNGDATALGDPRVE